MQRPRCSTKWPKASGLTSPSRRVGSTVRVYSTAAGRLPHGVRRSQLRGVQLARPALPLAVVVVDGLVDDHVSVADLQVEAAVGLSAHPRLVLYGAALPAVVGEGHQLPPAASAADREPRPAGGRPLGHPVLRRTRRPGHPTPLLVPPPDRSRRARGARRSAARARRDGALTARVGPRPTGGPGPLPRGRR